MFASRRTPSNEHYPYAFEVERGRFSEELSSSKLSKTPSSLSRIIRVSSSAVCRADTAPPGTRDHRTHPVQEDFFCLYDDRFHAESPAIN